MMFGINLLNKAELVKMLRMKSSGLTSTTSIHSLVGIHGVGNAVSSVFFFVNIV